MSKPLCIDLFCGLGGWSEGFLAEGYDCIGFDIERHDYGTGGYPGQLVLQDVRTLHGSQFKDAAVIVASPPCQKYSYMAMPWTRAKKMAEEYRSGARSVEELNELFNACFRIAKEAGLPLIVENVRGAQEWVGPAAWNYGSFYLWGDLPALMPPAFKHVKVPTMGAGWYPLGHPKHRPGLGFNTHAERNIKNGGGSWFNVAHNTASGVSQNPVHEAVKQAGISRPRRNGKGNNSAGWFQDGAAFFGSRSEARKAASAHIAKIPFVLSRHVARCYKLVDCQAVEPGSAV